MGNSGIISSNNRREMLWLFALLNAKVNLTLLKGLVKAEQEKFYFFAIKRIKEYVRVPNLSNDLSAVKDEVIESVEALLALEDVNLSDLVDFTGTMMQRIDGARVKDGMLLLQRGESTVACPILRQPKLVAQVVQQHVTESALTGEGQIRLTGLRHLPAMDERKIRSLQEYIDHLLFALYYRVSLPRLGLAHSPEIQVACSQHECYGVIFPPAD